MEVAAYRIAVEAVTNVVRHAEATSCVVRIVEGDEHLAWLDLRALGLGDHPAEVLRARTGIALVDGALCGTPGRGHARLNFAG